MTETCFLVLTPTLTPVVLENSFCPFSILCDRVGGEGSKPELPWPLPTLCVLVTQLCLTLCDSMDCSPPGSSVHGNLQARLLEWVDFPSSRGSSQPRYWTQVSLIVGGFFTSWATREGQEYWSGWPIPSSADLPDPGIYSGSHALQADSLPADLWGKPFQLYHYVYLLNENQKWSFPLLYYNAIWLFNTNLVITFLNLLEKTLQSPLDCKEIKTVHPKGNQSWIFIGKTDAEAETLIHWSPDVKSWLTGKDPDVGKDWRQEKKGITEDEMVGWHHQFNGQEFWVSSGSWWWTGKPGKLQSMGLQRVRHDWVTELNWVFTLSRAERTEIAFRFSPTWPLFSFQHCKLSPRPALSIELSVRRKCFLCVLSNRIAFSHVCY